MASAEIESFRGRLFRELDRNVKALDGLDEKRSTGSRPRHRRTRSSCSPRTRSVPRSITSFASSQGGRSPDRATPNSRQGVRGHLPARAAEMKQRIDDALTGGDPASLGDERETPFGKRTARDLLLRAVAHSLEHAGQAELMPDLYIAKRGTT